MSGGPLIRTGVLLLTAPAGMMLGHALTYLLALPDPHMREHLLAETGHGWWSRALPVAGVLFLGSLLLALTGSEDSKLARRELARWVTPRLAALQIVLFVAVEVLERVAAGQPLDGVFAHHLLSHGLFAQALVACGLVAAWWLLAFAVDLSCETVESPAPPLRPEAAPSETRLRTYPSAHLEGTHGARAPPLGCGDTSHPRPHRPQGPPQPSTWRRHHEVCTSARRHCDGARRRADVDRHTARVGA